jgi:uncharacterized membrane protein YeiH
MHSPSFNQAISLAPRIADLAGITLFAASGAIAAARKQLDVVAACFFALITATGGGTLRDLLIGVPVFWMSSPVPIIVCMVVGALIWLMPLRLWPDATMEWFDGVGLAAYAVYGAAKALAFGQQPVQAAAMGVVTACMGGIIRDMVAGVPSIMLRNELYVTAAIVAATVFVGLTLLGVQVRFAVGLSFTAGFCLRGIAIRYGLKLPRRRR